jgi:hypothetical protein
MVSFPQDTDYINKITVQGYKSLYEESSIEIRPLTILAGANSSGKSSIMQPLLLMKQTLEEFYDPGPLLLNGANIKFTSLDQLFARKNQDDISQSFSIKLDLSSDKSIATSLKRSEDGLEISETIVRNQESLLKIKPDMSGKELELAVTKYHEAYNYSYNKPIFLARNDLYPDISQLISPVEEYCKITTKYCFLRLTCVVVAASSAKTEQTQRTPSFQFDNRLHIKLFLEKVKQLIHIPGIRSNPVRTYPTTSVDRDFPGQFENYIASIVYQWRKSGDSRLEKLARTLSQLQLTDKVEARKVNDVAFELMVSRLKSQEVMVNIADVGFGTRVIAR